jgi:hypothetical protein
MMQRVRLTTVLAKAIERASDLRLIVQHDLGS